MGIKTIELRCKDCKHILHIEGECYAICGKDGHHITEIAMFDEICEYPPSIRKNNKIVKISKFPKPKLYLWADEYR